MLAGPCAHEFIYVEIVTNIIIQCKPSLCGLSVVIQAKGSLHLSRRLGHQIGASASHRGKIVGYTR
jgi:hypothetical protein